MASKIWFDRQDSETLSHLDAQWELIAESVQASRPECRRVGQRYTASAAVTVIWGGRTVKSVLRDLSVSGCAINCPTEARVGEAAMLLVTSGKRAHQAVEGRCARSTGAITAFEFICSSDSDRLAIAELQDRIFHYRSALPPTQASQAARGFSPPRQQLASNTRRWGRMESSR